MEWNTTMLFDRLEHRWLDFSLAKKFAIVSSVVLLVGMGAIGTWVSAKISSGVTENTAVSTALYVESLIAPALQPLVDRDTLTRQSRRQLQRILSSTALGQRILTIKVWKPGGLIAYSSRKEMIGKRFPSTRQLSRAWLGIASAEFNALDDEEDVGEKAAGLPLLEMYAPVRAIGNDEVIAVAEFYIRADRLLRDTSDAIVQSWMVVGFAAVAMALSLWAMVRQASGTIESQRDELAGQVDQLTQLLDQNQVLRHSVENAYRRTARLNERFLRRIGADLHDGPAQLIGLALLRLDSLSAAKSGGTNGNGARTNEQSEENKNLESVRSVLSESLHDIRNLSAGLSVPELGHTGPGEVLNLAIHSHENRTGSVVVQDADKLPDKIPDEITVCMYRFVQEGLSNTYRHARDCNTTVRARCDEERIEIEVIDDGPGFDLDEQQDNVGMGLIALRDRVEALGGWFDIRSSPGKGTRLALRFTQRALDQLEQNL